MSGDVHVQFCERPGVRFPRATHLRLPSPATCPGTAEVIVVAAGEVEPVTRHLPFDGPRRPPGR